MPTALREAVEHGSPDVTAFVTQHCNEAADTVSISVTVILFSNLVATENIDSESLSAIRYTIKLKVPSNSLRACV